MTVSVTIPSGEAPAVNPNQPAAPEVTTTETGAVRPEAAAPTRPDNVPEKFWDAEKGSIRTDALLTSYTELEGRLGSAPAASQSPATTPAQEAQVQQTLQANGLDIASFNAEYNANGGLSPESYAKLAAAGLDRNFVDSYIAGQEAIASADIQAVYAEVGGEAEFQKVQTWAKANLPPSTLKAFNNIVDTGDRDSLIMAISGLQAKYVAANGKEPKLVNGMPGSAVDGYRSKAEIVAAMGDPRYRKDEAYRADVAARMAVTPF